MCKPGGNPKRLSRDVVERNSDPTPKRRRSAPYVYGDVKNTATNDAHEFALRLTDLIVKSPQNVSLGPAMIVLNIFDWKPSRCEFVLVERFEKESARVSPDTRGDNVYFVEGRSRYFHVAPLGTTQPEILIGGPGNREGIGKVN